MWHYLVYTPTYMYDTLFSLRGHAYAFLVNHFMHVSRLVVEPCHEGQSILNFLFRISIET